jgi:hypothetical protein
MFLVLLVSVCPSAPSRAARGPKRCFTFPYLSISMSDSLRSHSVCVCVCVCRNTVRWPGETSISSTIKTCWSVVKWLWVCGRFLTDWRICSTLLECQDQTQTRCVRNMAIRRALCQIILTALHQFTAVAVKSQETHYKTHLDIVAPLESIMH